MDAAVEAAENSNSEASTIPAPVQDVASADNGTDNRIGALDGISSFLQTLKNFNAVVGEVITVSITLCLRARRCSSDV